jgi:hypothetical protein
VEDRQAERVADQIDFPILWMLVRAAEILYIVVSAKMVYLTRGTQVFQENVASTGGLLIVVILFLHRVVTGRADSAGIHYRRYFRWKTLPWAEVQEVQWKNSRIRVLVKGRKKPKAILEFLLNPLKWTPAYWAHRSGTDVPVPPILERIHALPIETPPLNSVPLYSRWPKRVFMGVAILFVLVFLMRLIFALNGGSH